MPKKDWNKLVISTAMHVYILTSFWCVTQQHSGWSHYHQNYRSENDIWLSCTSKWSRYVDGHCSGHHQLVSVLFLHPKLTPFSLKDLLLYIYREGNKERITSHIHSLHTAGWLDAFFPHSYCISLVPVYAQTHQRNCMWKMC